MIQPLEKLDFIDRATLLHQLFPSEIPSLLQYVKLLSSTVISDLKEAEWHNSNIPFDFWVSLAQDIYDLVKGHEEELSLNSKRFALLLFDGYKAVFTANCFRLYIDTQQLPNKKFAMIVQVLFGYEK